MAVFFHLFIGILIPPKSVGACTARPDPRDDAQVLHAKQMLFVSVTYPLQRRSFRCPSSYRSNPRATLGNPSDVSQFSVSPWSQWLHPPRPGCPTPSIDRPIGGHVPPIGPINSFDPSPSLLHGLWICSRQLVLNDPSPVFGTTFFVHLNFSRSSYRDSHRGIIHKGHFFSIWANCCDTPPLFLLTFPFSLIFHFLNSF